MPNDNDTHKIEEHILQAIRDIKYGAVEVVIHDSRIVQIGKTEKLRFDTPRPSN